MLWKLGRIDGDSALRGTRVRATWEYVSSVGGGQQGMVGLGLVARGLRCWSKGHSRSATCAKERERGSNLLGEKGAV